MLELWKINSFSDVGAFFYPTFANCARAKNDCSLLCESFCHYFQTDQKGQIDQNGQIDQKSQEN